MGRHLFNRSAGAVAAPRNRRWPTATAVTAGAAVVALLGAGACGEESGSTTVDDPSTTVPSTSTTLPPLTALAEADTAPVSVPAPEGTEEPARLVGVRVGDHEGYDRVVFELEGDLPGYDVGYLEGDLYEEGSGERVDTAGSDVLSVRMTPASGVVMLDDGIEQVYTGKQRIEGDGDPVLEVVSAGDFEAQITWGIVVDGERPFQVSRLEAPNRLVIDVATF